MLCTYGDSLQCDVQTRRKFHRGDVDTMYLSDEGECADVVISRNTSTAEMTGGRTKILLCIYGLTT